MTIARPADLVQGAEWERRRDACEEESPCWGYEAEGEQCQRQPGHGPPHYAEVDEGDRRTILQWESIKKD